MIRPNQLFKKIPVVMGVMACMAFLFLSQGCWQTQTLEKSMPSTTAPDLSFNLIGQTSEEVETKNSGCISCHTQTDAPTMHNSPSVRLACVDCHGGRSEIAVPDTVKAGSAAYDEAMRKAHVQPRHPEAWEGNDGKYSSKNPEGSYTILNEESPDFIRFINPGDLRVAKQVCGDCHQEQVGQVPTSPMTTTSVFWSAAAYNNGIFSPAIGAQKTPFLGESYSMNGVPQQVMLNPPPTPEELARGVLPFVLPLPRWEIMPPGDIFRVFERGGITIPSNFPDIGTPPSLFMQQPGREDPGRPDIRQSIRGMGTGLRISIPVLNLHKTRLNDPHLSFLGTNDNPGDYRSSGCSACHVVYANDRDVFHSGPYAKFGNKGESQTADPTIPKKEAGHPLKHEFTKSIPTSQCMVCHMHQPNVFVNSFMGYTMWDYETDAEPMWPKKQKYPTSKEIREINSRNPEGAAPKGNWSDPEFLTEVSQLNSELKHTQFADYHGHGWNFRAVYKRDRKGNLLDDRNDVVSNVTSEKLQQAMKPRTDEEWKSGRPGVPVHLKDIHLEKGMHCVDCHFSLDNHGDGRLYGQYADAIEITCVDCHGTSDQYATVKTTGPMAPSGGTDLSRGLTKGKKRRFEWREGKLIQRSSLEKGKEWEVVQVKDTINPKSDWAIAHPKQAERSRLAKTIRKDGNTWGTMPPNHDELAHANEKVACYSCHLSWTTSCAGCHLPIQANWKTKSKHFEGEETRNFATYNPQVVRDDQFILGIHGTVKGGGKDKKLVAPVRSTSALVLSSTNTNRERIYVQQPPISAAGFSSQAFAPHFPHTVRATETKQCTDCHLSKDDDNNAWIQQVLGQGTNFPNFIGRHAWVGQGSSGFEAVPVTEWDEPQAVYGSYLHKVAYPDYYAEFLEDGREIPRWKDGRENAKYHGGKDIRSLQLRGEYLFTANGAGGFRVFDVASVDNKGFSENLVTAPVSPIGQRTYISSEMATDIALPTTMPVSPSRQDREVFTKHAENNQEQTMHPLYRYAYFTDSVEGLIIVDVETLSDGNPDNNFLHRAVTFNPDNILNGAKKITIAGNYAYISCARGLVIINIEDPLKPKVATEIGAPNLVNPSVVAVQFRYAFVLDEEGLKVLDITFPETPKVVSGAAVSLKGARDIYVARGYAYVAAADQGLVIINIDQPEQPKIAQTFTAEGQLNDAYAVKVASTNASLFAYVADGKNGLRVIQLTSPPTQPNYYGFNPSPVPELIATYKTKGPAIALSKGLDRDRAVDESGNQVSVFGRLGSRPFNLEEQQQMYLKNGQVYKVTNEPPGPPQNP